MKVNVRQPLRFPFDPLPFVLSLFITGILLARVLPRNPQIYLLSAGLILGISLLLPNRKNQPFWNRFRFFLLFPFFFIGISHSQYFQKPGPNDISRFRMKNPIIIKGVIINNPSEDKGQVIVQAERITEPISIWPVTGNILLVFRERPVPLRYGDRLRVRLVVEKPVSKDGFDYTGYLARHRIYAVAYPGKTDLAIIGTENKNPLLPFAFSVRSRIRNILTELVPEEPALSILEMMSFGLRNPKSELKEPFQKVGVYHLLVVSGLHVGFFLLFIHFILSPLSLHPRLKALLYLPAISAYTLACGLSAPVVRAGLMAGFYYLGVVLNRKSKPVYAISLAAFVLLLLNPLSLFDAGWQLTFGITLGLITGTKTLNPYFRRMPAWLANSLSATIIGQLVSIPLTAFHFGNIPTLGLVANLIFVPLSGLIVLETFLAILLVPFKFLFAATAAALTSFFYQTTRFLSELPFAFVTVPTGKYLYFLGYLPLIVLLLYSRKRSLS